MMRYFFALLALTGCTTTETLEGSTVGVAVSVGATVGASVGSTSSGGEQGGNGGAGATSAATAVTIASASTGVASCDNSACAVGFECGPSNACEPCQDADTCATCQVTKAELASACNAAPHGSGCGYTFADVPCITTGNSTTSVDYPVRCNWGPPEQCAVIAGQYCVDMPGVTACPGAMPLP